VNYDAATAASREVKVTMRIAVEHTTKNPANQRRWDRQHTAEMHPCWLCGVPVPAPTPGSPVHMVESDTSGRLIVDEPENGPDSQGGFPVGPACWRKIQAAIRAARKATAPDGRSIRGGRTMSPEDALALTLRQLHVAPAPPAICAECGQPVEALLEYEMLRGERGDAPFCRPCFAQAPPPMGGQPITWAEDARISRDGP